MPPRWTVEPVDANVAAGQEAIIHCQADGYPTPAITWKKAIGILFSNRDDSYVLVNKNLIIKGQQPGEYKDFLFEPNVHQYQNGSLNFNHVSKDNEGQYLCEAKNNIGTGVSKVIFLKVNGNKRAFLVLF